MTMSRFLRSLRFRLTMAFLLVSLIAVLLAGGIARHVLHKSFGQVSFDVAFDSFKGDVVAYIETYGSWQVATESEPFIQFERRRRAIEALVGLRPLQNNCENATALPEMTRSDLETADIPITAQTAPPFFFTLLDPKGKVLMPQDTQAPRGWRQTAVPIEAEDEIVAFAIPERNPNFNPFDRGYLKAMQQALQSSLAISGAVAAALGLVLADRFSRPIHQLTLATQAMRTGHWQRVNIQEKGEIGDLGQAFNEMSKRLEVAYKDLEESHEEIRELSIRDELTQLYNRRFFNEQALMFFDQAKRYNSPLSLMIGDIDYFKRINDSFSHQMGDRVLQCVAQLLMRHTRKSDLVARYGGEEFVIIFPETDREQAMQLCDRLRARIEIYNWSTLHPDLAVTMSMGVNSETQLGTVEKMLSAADQKLYMAKRNGRNQVC